MNISEKIKLILPLAKVVETYTGQKLVRNKMRCPFHSEKTASFTVYPNDSFYCFGCGASGDVFTFVMKFFNISFPQAMIKLDIDFCLGLYQKPSLAEHRKSQREIQKIILKRLSEQREKEENDIQYWKAFDKWSRLDKNKIQYAPKTPDEKWHPLFVEALKKIKYTEYLIDKAEIRRWIFENERGNNTVNANS